MPKRASDFDDPYAGFAKRAKTEKNIAPSGPSSIKKDNKGLLRRIWDYFFT